MLSHRPKLYQRACKANPICPQGIRIPHAQKNKIKLCFGDWSVYIGKEIKSDAM